MSTTLVALIEEAESNRSGDYLSLSKDRSLEAVLDIGEEIIWSDAVEKVNRHEKSQRRVLMITNLAMYTFIPKNYKAYRRRIPIREIQGISLSDSTDDVIIRKHNDFDLWIISRRRFEFVLVLARLFSMGIQQMSASPNFNEGFDELKTEVTARSRFPTLFYCKSSGINPQGRITSVDSLLKFTPNASLNDRITHDASSVPLDDEASQVDIEEEDKGLTMPFMAMNVTNRLRKLVSKKKKRYQKDGFDLDLSYILDSIIAMGFPSDDYEGIFRNRMSEVQRFLETKHKDHYKVYNLCSERSYHPAKFQRRVSHYGFDDHNCPEFGLILDCCKDIDDWLKSDPLNVVAIHCKAGKGRTGLIIASYLLYVKICRSPKEALELFARKRTENEKGVTIPSQLRYVEYFYQFLTEYSSDLRSFPFSGVPLVLTNIRIATVPRTGNDKGCYLYFTVRDVKNKKLYDSRKLSSKKLYRDETHIDIACQAFIRGDVKLLFWNEEEYSSDVELFHFWINTSFIEDNYMKLEKQSIDKACKDKSAKKFDNNLSVEMYFRSDDILAAQELKKKTSSGRSQTVEELFQLVKETQIELKEAIAYREKLEDDLEQALELNKDLKFEYDILQNNEEKRIRTSTIEKPEAELLISMDLGPEEIQDVENPNEETKEPEYFLQKPSLKGGPLAPLPTPPASRGSSIENY